MLQGKKMNMGCKLLLVLTLWAMSTEAFPRDEQKRECHLSSYVTLLPWKQIIFNNVRDKFETITLPSTQICTTSIFHRDWQVKELSVLDRMILVEAQLNFTIDMLKEFGDPSLSKELSSPLEILGYIRNDIKRCIQDQHQHQPQPHQSDKKLTTWLNKVQKAKRTETPACLETAVIFNLLRMLNTDLSCAAYKERCR
ncbi:interferon lambda-3-like [Carettochelys insculpta]|uniref:interferon lambda-3-like n=1 Tax=Carettochelys insculpta TaxID=44489 RepID=UPI003EBF7B36